MAERRIISLEQEAGMLLGDTHSGVLVLTKVLGSSNLPFGKEELKGAARRLIERVKDSSLSINLDLGLRELIRHGLAEEVEEVKVWQLTPKGHQVFDILFSPRDPTSQ